MKAIFKPTTIALLGLASEAYGMRLAVESRLAGPIDDLADRAHDLIDGARDATISMVDRVAPEVHTTMAVTQSKPDICESQNNPSHSMVMADLRRVFNQRASLWDKDGRPAMTEQEWIDFCKEKGLLQTTLQHTEEDNWGWSEEARIKFVFGHITGDRYHEWLPLTFEQFISGISMIGEYRRLDKYSGNPEQMKNRNTFEELVAWITDRDATKVTAVNFKHVEKFAAHGGSAGTQSFRTTIKTGRSSTKEVSHSAMAAVTASLEYANFMSPVSGSVTVEGSYNFDSVTTDSSSYEKETTESLSVDLSMPLFLYQKEVTIYYANGDRDSIGSGMVISSKPLPLNETVHDTCTTAL